MSRVFIAIRRLPDRLAWKWRDFRGYTPTDRNLYFLVIEILWIGLASGALGFNSAFVLKLGASNELVGAMSSLPALVVILLSIPAARFIEKRKKRKPWIVGSLGVSRMTYLFIACVPWVVPSDQQAVAIVALIVLQQVPLSLFSPAFWALVGDVCPSDRRSTLFSNRTMLLAGSIAVSAFVSGLFLDRAVFPLTQI